MPDTPRILARAYRELSACEDLTAGAECLKRMGQAVGMPHPAVIDDYSSVRLLTVEDGRVLTSVLGWDPEPVTEWIRQRLHLVSPIAAVCRMSTRPFAWDARTVADAVLDTRTRPAVNWPLTPERGFYGGITVPVHMPRGRTGSVSWYSRDPAIDVAAVLAEHDDVLRLAGLRFLDLAYAGRADIEASMDAAVPLSERELECLTWAALGRTDVEIGAIIHRSPTTARFHIDNAVRKLGARNRIQAVAMAAQRGLIHPLDGPAPAPDDAIEP